MYSIQSSLPNCTPYKQQESNKAEKDKEIEEWTPIPRHDRQGNSNLEQVFV